MVLWQIAGIALCGAGVFALYLAWQRKQRSWPLVSAGWALLLGSLLAWGQTSGVDKGPALGIVAEIIIALAAIAITAVRMPVKHRREPRTRISPGAVPSEIGHRVMPQAATIFIITLVGMAVTIAACTALFMGNRSLGLEHTANLTLAMFSFPLVWAGLATYVGYSDNVRGRVSVLFVILAISAAIIFGTVEAG